MLAKAGIRPRRWWTFGRDPACDVRVDDEYATGYHAFAFEFPAGVFWVADLGSTNGTWLTRYGHKQRIQRAWERIRPGDILTVGRTALPWTTTSERHQP